VANATLSQSYYNQPHILPPFLLDLSPFWGLHHRTACCQPFILVHTISDTSPITHCPCHCDHDLSGEAISTVVGGQAGDGEIASYSPSARSFGFARNDNESVSLGTSLAMTSEREPHNYGAVSPIYLGVITLCTPTLANYTKGSMRPPFKGAAIWYNN